MLSKKLFEELKATDVSMNIWSTENPDIINVMFSYKDMTFTFNERIDEDLDTLLLNDLGLFCLMISIKEADFENIKIMEEK